MARGDLALAVACDMPFLNPALLGFMLTLAQAGYDVVVPQVNDLLERCTRSIGRPAVRRLSNAICWRVTGA
ncbi:MAG: hypothetical protein IPO15_11525 [Anaerolineae bacterium]|uniref:NTP transferase domain-containing protein n=1 Tax=Candidatus Amarolinea dominans TaxID=3140696 RepID=UPI0031373630|nr:hypothetical protein [Anaerolineae bacterium]